MVLIALTGGIASGKSTVARRLAEHGAVVIDADQLSRQVIEPGTAGYQAVIEVFGEDVLHADRSLNRARLGEIVFADPAARAQLEAIIHPAVQQRFAECLAAATASDPHAVVVYDIPLLVEAESAHPYDLVVVLAAGGEAQLERLTSIRGMTEAAARARLAAQATDAERIARADVVIDSSGSLAETVAQLDAVWLDRIAPLR